MSQPQSRKLKILGDAKKARRTRALISTLIVAVIAIGIVATIILLTPPSGSSDTNLIGLPVSSTVYSQLTSVSDSTLTTIGTGQGASGLISESGSLLTSGGKVEVLYVGGDFCPFCAAERWSIIVALSKFGTWTDGTLTYMLSAERTPQGVAESYPDTHTFSFSNAVYNSSYIAFVGKEIYHRDYSGFETLSQQETNLKDQYDPSNGIPFIDIGNQFVDNSGSQYSPGLLSGNWTQIGSQLNNPNSSVAKAIDGAANYLISAICKTDGGMPSSLCTQSFGGLTQAPISAINMPLTNSVNVLAKTTSSDDKVWKSFPRLIF